MASSKEYFPAPCIHTLAPLLLPDIPNIPYKPSAGPEETLVFKHYNATELILGKTMEDWLRFSVCFWHTFRGTGLDPFGAPTIQRSWDDGSNSLDNAKRRLRAAFEFMKKLGVTYWTFHDSFYVCLSVVVFWGGREGYQSLLNTDVFAELSHMANFFKMAVEYKKKIGFTGQFLIEPKAKEPTRHQYDYDAMTVIAFLKNFGLDKDFKVVIEQKGIQPGGLNFDAKVRRESTDPQDLFIAHIGAMDAFARGLRNAAKVVEEGVLNTPSQGIPLCTRYMSFDTGLGAKIANGTASLEECEAFIKDNGEPEKKSAKQEHFEAMFNYYV
ncbi:hypothetical protein LSH36_1050g00046 [Paralvinella palmiformis]|uniref:Xylose isomerase n=1 Tax=Paralvinella palmiformis TaxID=53620 RepID=A0AAD9IW94_9ANNE|nr:hypothetical protein LSH36_1050g00046 [Paralvinella palmiformis]